MTTYAQLRGKSIVLDPTTDSEVENGSMYMDSGNSNVATIKGVGGSIAAIDAGASVTNATNKIMQAAEAIGANVPVSKKADGKIVRADSDAADGQKFIGITIQEAVNPDDLINIQLVGPNMVNAIQGLGYTPAEEIFLSETTGEYTNDPDSFTNGDDSVIRIGVADCAAGIASATATDLIMFNEVILRPS